MNKFGLEHPGVLDAFAHDTKRDVVILAMYETRPWTGGDQQIFQLQEKLNAYASFLLDGEFNEAYPEFAGKPVQIQLRTRHEPSEKALGLIAQVREQLAFQKVGLEVIQIAPESGPGHEDPEAPASETPDGPDSGGV